MEALLGNRPTRALVVEADKPSLVPAIGLSRATAMVVGTIIGASIFVQPSVITGAVPTLGAVYLVWIVSGILTLFGALIAAELASAYPQAGGQFLVVCDRLHLDRPLEQHAQVVGEFPKAFNRSAGG